jgi:hypothetical protein
MTLLLFQYPPGYFFVLQDYVQTDFLQQMVLVHLNFLETLAFWFEPQLSLRRAFLLIKL